MDAINKGIEMMFAKAKAEDGNFSLDDADLVGIFNDATIVVWLENEQLKVKVIVGEPDRFDFNLDLLDK